MWAVVKKWLQGSGERIAFLRGLLACMDAKPPPAKRPCPEGDSDSLTGPPEVVKRPCPEGASDSLTGPPGVARSAEEKGTVESEEQHAEEPGRTAVRFGKRKKFAVLVSYSGSGYNGMQK